VKFPSGKVNTVSNNDLAPSGSLPSTTKEREEDISPTLQIAHDQHTRMEPIKESTTADENNEQLMRRSARIIKSSQRLDL